MPLDPEAAEYLELLRQQEIPSLESLSVDDARAQLTPVPGSPEQVAGVIDRTVPGPAGPIPVRRYRANDAPSPNGGAVVFFHGGGWILGSLDSHDAFCRRLCRESNADVIAVDYRMGPEHRFPAAIDDCEAATRWVYDHAEEWDVDPTRIAVCGDSAGGNLAAVVALRVRGTIPLAAQVLLYPITDHSFETESYRENGDGYFLSRATMEWFWNNYLSQPGEGASPDASPLRAADFCGLPPAYVMTAGYDPLRDEGRAYAEALIHAGIDVQFREFTGMVHGFLRRIDRFPSATTAIKEIASFLNRCL